MKKVFKYTIPDTEYQQIALPSRSTVLRVEYVGNALSLWALVHEGALRTDVIEYHTMIIAATGKSYDFAGLRYVNTYFAYDGIEVYHVFTEDKQYG